MNISDFPAEHIAKMQGGVPIEDFESDGCTRVRDRVLDDQGREVCVYLACLFHDWHYHLGTTGEDAAPVGTEEARQRADDVFHANMLALGASLEFAFIYHRGVRVFGAFGRSKGFQYQPKRAVLVRLWYSIKAVFLG